MADPRFFKKHGSFTARELAQMLDCTLLENANPDIVLTDVAPLKTATSSDLSFLDNIKYKEDFIATKAGACFVSPTMKNVAPADVVCLITNTPYKAYAKAAQKFYPFETPNSNISPKAYIHNTAKIARGCVIECGAYIGANAEIGESVWIEANSVISENVKIGSHCRIGPNASVAYSIIGNHVRIYPGARLGQDGFGFAIDKAGHVKVPQLGRVIIGDNVEIGANTCIDRGAGPDTIVGDGTWIDNLVQIGHNVVIGKGCVIVAQVGISGSTVIGDYVAIGGQVGIAGHLHIGTGAKIAGQSGVMRNIPAGEEHMGSPAFPKKDFLKQVVTLNRLIKDAKSE